MKKFDQFPTFYKWFISILFGVALVVVLILWIKAVREYKILMLLIFIIVPIIQFLITPLFTLLKLYTYYSPMVVSFGNNTRVIDLHNGTSFDYLLEMSTIKPGIKWKNKMLYHYLNALLNIIHQIENGVLSNSTIIRGSSYFLSQRSAEKLGFTVSKSSTIEKWNIALNYIDLIWTYSLSNGKLTFPNLNTITTVRTTGEELIKRKQTIQKFVHRLER